MKILAENAHVLQKIYNPGRANKLFMASHFHFQDHVDLIFDKNILMPLFKLSVASSISKTSIKTLYLQSEYKKQELYDCNTFLVLSAYSDQAVYRSKAIYTKRDGLEQIFKYLALPHHTYNIQINLLSYFLPQRYLLSILRVLFKQVLQALSQLQLLDEKQLSQLNISPSIIGFKSGNQLLSQILWGNHEFVDYERWKQLLKRNSIINIKTLHQFSLSQQLVALYFLKYNYNSQQNEDLKKINKYLVEDFDMFTFRSKLEHNEKQMKYYFLRMIKKFELNTELEQLLKIHLKSYSLEWNKQLFIELKSIINQQDQ